jgi:hypothetical protein
MKAYIAISAMYHNHASYLREWIEFHRLVGVERFILYNNDSADEHARVLAPYVKAGIVVVHDWPLPFLSRRGRAPGMVRAYDHCLDEHGSDARWIAFLDIDEFLFASTGVRLGEALLQYEAWPGVCVCRAQFGPSGHRTRPEGLVVESYLLRLRYDPDAKGPYKSIVDPSRVARCATVHHFEYREGFAVDAQQRRIGFPLSSSDWPGRIPITLSPLRINHYATKSLEELEVKQSRWAEIGHLRIHQRFRAPLGVFNERDEVITSYLPALHEAVERPPPA